MLTVVFSLIRVVPREFSAISGFCIFLSARRWRQILVSLPAPPLLWRKLIRLCHRRGRRREETRKLSRWKFLPSRLVLSVPLVAPVVGTALLTPARIFLSEVIILCSFIYDIADMFFKLVEICSLFRVHNSEIIFLKTKTCQHIYFNLCKLCWIKAFTTCISFKCSVHAFFLGTSPLFSLSSPAVSLTSPEALSPSFAWLSCRIKGSSHT